MPAWIFPRLTGRIYFLFWLAHLIERVCWLVCFQGNSTEHRSRLSNLMLFQCIVWYLFVALFTVVSVCAFKQVTLDKLFHWVQQSMMVTNIHIQRNERCLAGVPEQRQKWPEKKTDTSFPPGSKNLNQATSSKPFRWPEGTKDTKAGVYSSTQGTAGYGLNKPRFTEIFWTCQ